MSIERAEVATEDSITSKTLELISAMDEWTEVPEYPETFAGSQYSVTGFETRVNSLGAVGDYRIRIEERETSIQGDFSRDRYPYRLKVFRGEGEKAESIELEIEEYSQEALKARSLFQRLDKEIVIPREEREKQAKAQFALDFAQELEALVVKNHKSELVRLKKTGG